MCVSGETSEEPILSPAPVSWILTLVFGVKTSFHSDVVIHESSDF
ncbi:hypothetical protein ES705_50705 [subsurface metagenome]